MALVNDSLCIIKLQSDLHDCNKQHVVLAVCAARCFVCILSHSLILYLTPVRNAVLVSLTVISPPLSDGASQHQPSGAPIKDVLLMATCYTCWCDTLLT